MFRGARRFLLPFKPLDVLPGQARIKHGLNVVKETTGRTRRFVLVKVAQPTTNQIAIRRVLTSLVHLGTDRLSW